MRGEAEHWKDGVQTIAVVADHTLIRTSVVRFLRYELADRNFVELVSTDELSSVRGKDVCLVALCVAGKDVTSDGIREDLEAVRRQFPTAAIALLSDTDDILAESRALEMGVRGYFTNSLPIDIALAGVRLVLAGGVFCPHPLATLKYSSGSGPGGGRPEPNIQADYEPFEMTSPMRREGIAGFTPRETDVLAELRLGHSNEVIAGRLNMSGNTVKMHLQHIMRKLHVQNRTEVVVLLAPKVPAWSRAATADPLSNGSAP